MGKTTLLYNILINRLVSKNEKVLLLSTNDNRKSIHSKLKKIIDGLENPTAINSENILISPQKINDPIVAKKFIEDTIKEHDIKAIYIDDISELSYINEMYYYNDDDETFSDYSEYTPWNQGIGIFLQFIKTTVNNYQIPLVLTEEISREMEQRSGLYRMPRISDMRSEKLESIADKIYLLCRQAYYGITEDEEGNTTKGVMSVFVGKNKSGNARQTIELLINSNSLYK